MHTHLTRVHLKGYRNIQDTEMTFREGLNIIIGPNGCGKTNFLWLLANIGNEEINNENIIAEIECKSFYKNELLYDIKEHIHHIEHKLNFDSIIDKKVDKIIYKNNTDNSLVGNFSYISLLVDILGFEIPSPIQSFSEATTLNLKKNQTYYSATNTDNKVLGRFIVDKSQDIIKNKESFRIKDLNFDNNTINVLKKYTPIQDIRVEYPQRNNEIKETETTVSISTLIYGFKTNNEWFKWNELSDGTRRIAWIVLNILFNGGRIALIEEPELGIHPHQLKLLMQFIKEQSQHKQIILTTHAPEVLDILDADELDRIRIARYDEERKTTVIEGIPEKRQAIIQKYLQKTGLLSGFWSRIDLEGTKGFPKT